MATRGTTQSDDEAEGANKITFENKAKFKDNFRDVSFVVMSLLVLHGGCRIFSPPAVCRRMVSEPAMVSVMVAGSSYQDIRPPK